MSSFKDRFGQKTPTSSPRIIQAVGGATASAHRQQQASAMSATGSASVNSLTAGSGGAVVPQPPSSHLLQALSAQTSPMRTPSSVCLDLQHTPDPSSTSTLSLPSSALVQGNHTAQPAPLGPNKSPIAPPTTLADPSPRGGGGSASTMSVTSTRSNQHQPCRRTVAPLLDVDASSLSRGEQQPSGSGADSASSSTTSQRDDRGLTSPIRGARVNALLEQHAASSATGTSVLPLPASPVSQRGGGYPDSNTATPRLLGASTAGAGGASPSFLSGRKLTSFSSLTLSATGRSGSRGSAQRLFSVAAPPTLGGDAHVAGLGGDAIVPSPVVMMGDAGAWSRAHLGTETASASASSSSFVEVSAAGGLHHTAFASSTTNSSTPSPRSALLMRQRSNDVVGPTVRAIISDATFRRASDFADEATAWQEAHGRVRETSEFVFPFHPPPPPPSGVGQLLELSWRDPISIHYDDEVGRFIGGPRIGGDDAINVGNCNCSDVDTQQFFPGFDLRKYKAHALFHHCVECNRRPSAFLCLNCFQSVCPSHVSTHYHQGGGTTSATTTTTKTHQSGSAAFGSKCFLFLNYMDLDHSFDRQLWCERCERFTWKSADTYEPLVEQILYTRGSYLPSDPVRDVHVIGYDVDLYVAAQSLCRVPSVVSDQNAKTIIKEGGMNDGVALSKSRWVALSTTVQGWRAAQEDAEAVFTVQIPSALFLAVAAKAKRQQQRPSGAAAIVDDAQLPTAIPMCCFAVFDGHGGDAVSNLAAASIEDHLQRAVDAVATDFACVPLAANADGLCKELFAEAAAAGEPSCGEGEGIAEDSMDGAKEHLRRCLQRIFQSVFDRALIGFDDALRQSKEGRQGDFNCVGSTATIVGVVPLMGQHMRAVLGGEELTVVANLGDSGAAAVYQLPSTEPAAGGRTNHLLLSMLTHPHRLEDQSEINRIKAAGYGIQGGRIEGLLAVPRALGDFDFKQCGGGRSAKEQAVTACPTVSLFTQSDLMALLLGHAPSSKGEATFCGVLVACDGLWDSYKHLSSIEALLSSPLAATPTAASGGGQSPQQPPARKNSLRNSTGEENCCSQQQQEQQTSASDAGGIQLHGTVDELYHLADDFPLHRSSMRSEPRGIACPASLRAVFRLLQGTIAARMRTDDDIDENGNDDDEDLGTDNCSVILAMKARP